MSKHNINKTYRSLFLLIFFLFMFAVLNGCGTRQDASVTPGTATGLKITVTPTPTSVVAGALSVIVAQVNYADDTVASGVPVTFNLTTNNSGAPALTIVNATTDASGTAIATYTAGDDFPGFSKEDAVTVSVTGSSDTAIITRLPAAGTGNRIISFTEDPETAGSTAASGPVIMKVTVTTDDLTSPVVDVTVTLSIILGEGTLTDPDAAVGDPVGVLTDTNGEAYVIFTRPATGTGETVIRAQIPGTTNGGDAARIVYWTDGL